MAQEYDENSLKNIYDYLTNQLVESSVEFADLIESKYGPEEKKKISLVFQESFCCLLAFGEIAKVYEIINRTFDKNSDLLLKDLWLVSMAHKIANEPAKIQALINKFNIKDYSKINFIEDILSCKEISPAIERECIIFLELLLQNSTSDEKQNKPSLYRILEILIN